MLKRILWYLIGVLVAWSSTLYANEAPVDESSPGAHVAMLKVEGAIGPATTDYLLSAMTEAREQGAMAVVMQLDTPGGLDASTRDIVKGFLASPIPVITYVHPAGARAASAGTYILYASHLAAMTPSTTLGAATPVRMGAGADGTKNGTKDAQTDTSETDQESESSAPIPENAMERKTINDAVAFIRGLAARHNRNADWAERAVREAVSLTASQALAENVVDVVAADVEQLLEQAHGRTVRMDSGEHTLDLDGLPVKQYQPNWRNKLLALITNPQIAYILLLIGIYGLIFEGYSPGAMVPGVVGVISLLLAFYALQVLPISYAGLALIIVGALLIAAEAFVPSVGVLGIGGVISLVIGSIMLIDTDVPGMMISTELIAAIGAVSSLLVLTVLVFAGRSLSMPRVQPSEALVGRNATVVDSSGDDDYQVRVHGELWQAQCTDSLQPGQSVKITHQHGLKLKVEPENSHEESL